MHTFVFHSLSLDTLGEHSNSIHPSIHPSTHSSIYPWNASNAFLDPHNTRGREEQTHVTSCSAKSFKKTKSPFDVLSVSFYNVSSIHSTWYKLWRKTKKNRIRCLASQREPVSYPPPWRFDPFILVFQFGRRAETTACRPPVLRSDLAASLRWPPPHLSQTERSTAGQHPGTKRAHKALIQANTSYFMRVSRRAGSRRGNRMFLANVSKAQAGAGMLGREPEPGVLFLFTLQQRFLLTIKHRGEICFKKK